MTDVVQALARGEAIEQVPDALPEGLPGPLACLSEPFLELCEGHFNWVKIRAVWWKEEQGCAALLDQGFDPFALVAGEVIQNDDIAGSERRGQDLGDVLSEDLPVHRLADDKRRNHSLACQAGKKGRGTAMPGRGMTDDPLALGGAAIAPGQVGGRGGFIKEDQTMRCQFRLAFTPQAPSLSHIRAMLFSGVNGFFYS